MKLIYHGQHGPEVTVGNPGVGDTVVMASGKHVEVPDELAEALLAEQPDTFTKAPTKSAAKQEG